VCASETLCEQVICSGYPDVLNSAVDVIFTVNKRDITPLLRVTSDDFLVKKVNLDTYTALITPGSPTGLVSHNHATIATLLVCHYCYSFFF
jgi:hypothetical protein